MGSEVNPAALLAFMGRRYVRHPTIRVEAGVGCEIRASRLNHRDYGLYHVISDVHADWPNSATTQQQSAIKYLSNQTCACDNIRDEYNADQNITTWKTMLTGLPYAAGNGFNRTTFAQVQKQLGTELSDVFVVDG